MAIEFNLHVLPSHAIEENPIEYSVYGLWFIRCMNAMKYEFNLRIMYGKILIG